MSTPLPRRVLSPHLQVYRLPFNAWVSILHRITGVLWSVALLAATALLWMLAGGADAVKIVSWLATAAGQALLFVLVFALMFHWAAGLRHLLLDLGWGFSAPWPTRSAWLVPVVALAGTVLAWVL